MDDLSFSDMTPECLKAREWRRNEGLMDEDDGDRKSRPPGERKRECTLQNKMRESIIKFFKKRANLH